MINKSDRKNNFDQGLTPLALGEITEREIIESTPGADQSPAPV